MTNHDNDRDEIEHRIESELGNVRDIESLRQRALDALNTDEPACDDCTENDPLLVIVDGDAIRCRRCYAVNAGRAPVEEHHPAGQNNNADDTIALGVNDHYLLSMRQHSWPTATLRNPHQSPLLAYAAAIRAWLDVMRHIIFTTVGSIPEYLEQLDAWLTTHLGPNWWLLMPATPTP